MKSLKEERTSLFEEYPQQYQCPAVLAQNDLYKDA